MRVAGIDCGTNSIRLLVADAEQGRLLDVHREMRVVRLGEGVDRTGRLAPAALERTRAALADYAGLITAHGARRVRMVATSATRDAVNRDDFTAMVERTLGAPAEVISGDEEAQLTFAGAVAGLPGAQGRLLVADIGGGSTELVLGNASGVQAAFSMDVGCVRMTERHLHDDPPTEAQVSAVIEDLRAAIGQARRTVPVQDADTFVAVAGTPTTLAAMVLGLERYDADAIHGTVLSARQVRDVTRQLLASTQAERARIPVIHPGRVDVIAAGALVLRALLEATGAAEVVVSEHDILDGIALSLLD